jgi:addiction module HigA family antidote
MTKTDTFNPDYRIPPGEILNEYLESLGMTPQSLAGRTGLAVETINDIIVGSTVISADTAMKLAQVVGRPAHFWQNLERLHRQGDAGDSESP